MPTPVTEGWWIEPTDSGRDQRISLCSSNSGRQAAILAKLLNCLLKVLAISWVAEPGAGLLRSWVCVQSSSKPIPRSAYSSGNTHAEIDTARFSDPKLNEGLTNARICSALVPVPRQSASRGCERGEPVATHRWME